MRRSSRRPVCASRASARPEIGIERALVKFVEQHRGDAGQFRIVENLPREDALGDDLDSGRARHFRAEADAIADGVADALAQRLRHALGAGAGRDPPRLQHDDLPVAEPRRIEQRQRHPRGLAGAGRRHQHRGVVARERARQFVEHRVDRKGRVEAAGQGLCINSSSPAKCAGRSTSSLGVTERQDVDGRTSPAMRGIVMAASAQSLTPAARPRARRSHR